MRTKWQVVLILLFLTGSYTQAQEPKPAAIRTHFDSGWWARAHWRAAGLDYASTGLAAKEASGFYEKNPLARPFVGGGSPARLSAGFAAEAIGVSLIPNHKLRRIVQIAAIGLHTYYGARNLKRWH